MTFNCDLCNGRFDEDTDQCPMCACCPDCCDCADLIGADVAAALKASDEMIDQAPYTPMVPCPHCGTSAMPRPLTFSAGVARAPHIKRARWKCVRCDTIYDVTSSAGHPDTAQVIRPGRIP